MGREYLLVDLGTGSSRVALVSAQGEILGMESFANPYYRDEAYEDAQYFRPEEWRENILTGCKKLCEAHPDRRIAAVSSAGARQSIVLLDREGNAFLGLPNVDNRGRAYMGEIPEKAAIYQQTGKWVTEDFPAAKLLGFRKKYPREYAKIAKITSLSEWIAQIFTGEIVMEPSQACETQLYDIGRRTWSETICGYYGVDPAILPRLQNAGEAVGPLRKEYQALLHSEDAVFILGGADTQIAVKQAHIQIGDIAIVSGTTSPVVTRMETQFYDPRQRVWTDADLGGRTYQIEMNPGVTGLNYQRIRGQLFPDWGYDQLEAAYAEKTEFHCTASFSSLLFDQGRALKRGGFFMKSPFDMAVEPLDLLWAVLADIGCSIYEQFRNLCALTDNRKTEVLGCGGGFQSPALCQMVADLTGRQFKLYPGFDQATIRGMTLVCNEYFGVLPSPGGQTPILYFPRGEQLIHRYYPVWLENRNQANQSFPISKI
ncbi:MAG: FGGY family carbohydrate kinase [Oscillibacter sp.]